MYTLFVFNGGLVLIYNKMYLFKMIIPSLQYHESLFQVFQTERLSLIFAKVYDDYLNVYNFDTLNPQL